VGAELHLPDELRASIAAGALLAAGWALRAGAGGVGAIAGAGTVLIWASLLAGLVYGGRAALDALRARQFDIDVLMALAAVLAAAVGHPEDGALLLFLFVLSGALEDRAMRRATRAVEALHKLMPTSAQVLRRPAGGGEPAWIEADPATLGPGERVRIRAGELVPADATVASGMTSIDQATLTGESMPRAVAEGDELYAGTLNTGQPIEAMVTRRASESSLQRVLDLVISAQKQREPMQRVIDRLSQPYAIGVVAVSVAVFLVWWLLLGVPPITAEGYGSLYTAIALLIIGSPCALIIATPTATLAAISRAARAGLLFKGGHAIERLARMGAVALDKTGTLTAGRPRLHQVHAIAWSSGADILGVAAALESGSTHPIATAVVEAARRRGTPGRSAAEILDAPGRGLSGVVDGAEARLGTYEHCEGLIPVCLRSRARDVLERVRSRGQIAVVIAWSRVPEAPGEPPAEAGQAGVLILSDTIRPGAKEMIGRLHEMGVRPVRMLTGDNRATAGHVAAQLGIDSYAAELLPEVKVRFLAALTGAARAPAGGGGRARGVGVIGDGVNDAPALAAADVSVAIGSIGSDAALESADIVLLNDNLLVIPWAVRLARLTRGIIVFNIALALAVIAGMGVATLIGSRTGWDVPLSVAVLAHEGGTLLVVANSLRLLLAATPRSASGAALEDSFAAEPEPAAAAA
jgi:Cd2+/Zn2+-exporting ATPase